MVKLSTKRPIKSTNCYKTGNFLITEGPGNFFKLWISTAEISSNTNFDKIEYNLIYQKLTFFGSFPNPSQGRVRGWYAREAIFV